MTWLIFPKWLPNLGLDSTSTFLSSCALVIHSPIESLGFCHKPRLWYQSCQHPYREPGSTPSPDGLTGKIRTPRFRWPTNQGTIQARKIFSWHDVTLTIMIINYTIRHPIKCQTGYITAVFSTYFLRLRYLIDAFPVYACINILKHIKLTSITFITSFTCGSNLIPFLPCSNLRYPKWKSHHILQSITKGVECVSIIKIHQVKWFSTD